MEENDKLDIPLYLDSSDAVYWDEEKYLSEHNYEELVDLESAKTLLNFGDDYRNFIESNNSEVQSPRFIEALKQKKSSAKIEVNYLSIKRDIILIQYLKWFSFNSFTSWVNVHLIAITWNKYSFMI